MANKLTFELKSDQVDSIVLSEMKELYENCRDEVYRYEQKFPDLEMFEHEDMMYMREALVAAEFMIRYYLPFEDAAKYFEKFNR